MNILDNSCGAERTSILKSTQQAMICFQQIQRPVLVSLCIVKFEPIFTFFNVSVVSFEQLNIC